MAGRRRYKSAYRMTSRRKAALRKAQLISARKRKGSGRGLAAKVGVLTAVAGGAVGIYGGMKYGSQIKDVASSVRRSFRFTTPNNSAVNAVQPDVTLANTLQAGATNAQAARQAAPVQPPNMNNTSTPAPSRRNGPAAKAVPGFGGATGRQQALPQTLKPAESIIDPQKPQRSPFPAELMPTKKQVLTRLGKSEGDSITREDAQAISLLWEKEKLQGVQIPKNHRLRNRYVGNVGVYTGVLDMFGLETAKAEKERLGKA